MPRDHGKLSVTIFWFHENSWEPTSFLLMYMQKQFSGNMLFKLKLKNISVYSCLQKTSMSIIKMWEEGQFKSNMCMH